jgi:nucleoid DNA-binding protein
MATKAASKLAAKSSAKSANGGQDDADHPELPAEAQGKGSAVLRVRDLIDRVASGAKQDKKDVRAIVEATLAELGKALVTGNAMNLPPFGKIRIANQKGDASNQIFTLKLRRGGDEKSSKKAEKQGLANASEDS